MFRPIITKDYHPHNLRVPIPQRSTFPTPSTTTSGQHQDENDNERFLDMSHSLMIPSNIFTSNNMESNTSTSTAFVVPKKPPRPDTPRSSSYPSACSPLTVCSDTWRHSPSPFPNNTNGFIPIADKNVVPAPLPLSQVLPKQFPWKTTSESAYHPYATPSPIHRGRALLSPSLTADTCSVTTLGTDATATTFTTKFLSQPAPTPPPFLSPLHAKQLRSPASSLAVAAGWCLPPIRPNTTATPTGISISSDRPQSAPTLPSTTGSTTTPTPSSGPDERKIRLKTELCMHYENGRRCPFGINCTYAHGTEELQMTKLQDLHDAGLVDQATYRIKPCLTWIMTGSCPFGKRCTGIHDSRVASTYSSWLPHTETQGNTIATDINVEGLFQKRLYEILYDNPLGDSLDLQEALKCPQAAFENLYALVCGETHDATTEGGGGYNKSGWKTFHYRKSHKGNGSAAKKGGNRGGRSAKVVHPIYKLQIALKLRGEADWQYKYRPQHVVHDELCMVLQKRAFRVTSNATTTTTNKSKTKTSPSPLSSQRLNRSTATAISSVQEIDLRAYNPGNYNHILVHEIAFGPDADPSVRGVALWFNIDEDAVTLCTPQQAKRFRWKKSMPMAATKPMPTKLVDMQSNPTSSVSVFDSQLENFPMIRPHDEAAFRLVTDMLKHRLAVLKRERMTTLQDRLEHLRKLEEQKVVMRDERFVNQLRDWVAWAWPINAGRERVDVHTPVPPVEGPYCLVDQDNDSKTEDPAVGQENQVSNIVKGAHVHRIWHSFVEQCPIFSEEQEQARISANGTPPAVLAPRHRLAIFQDLANGKEIDTECRALPHILKHRITNALSGGKNTSSSNKDKAVVKHSSRHQERCWKALMLLPEKYPNGNITPVNNNEWSIVRQHFSNSRSHKVLTIIQQ